MTTLDVHDSPKMLRESLCLAQARVGQSPLDVARKREHVARLQRLIDECDRHRPLGRGGKHGDLHTPTCGCTDRQVPTMPTSVGLVLDLHATTVSMQLLECACGWLVRRGPGAQEAWRRHLEAELLEATT